VVPAHADLPDKYLFSSGSRATVTDSADDSAVGIAAEPALVRTAIEERGGYPGHVPESYR